MEDRKRRSDALYKRKREERNRAKSGENRDSLK
jgi:hypothetical protein